MADWSEEEHPRDDKGKFRFTQGAGAAEVSKKEPTTREGHAARAEEHRKATRDEMIAAEAHQRAAAQSKDPSERSDHLAKAALHREKAAEHLRQHEISKTKEKAMTSSIGKWISSKVGEYRELQETLLKGSPGEILKAGVEQIGKLPGRLVPKGGEGEDEAEKEAKEAEKEE